MESYLIKNSNFKIKKKNYKILLYVIFFNINIIKHK